jgi:hypothetical protein
MFPLQTFRQLLLLTAALVGVWHHCTLQAQTPIAISEVVLVGEIAESFDYFGRQIYSGTVEVRGEKRLDYIAVEVVVQDSSEIELESIRSFVFGTRFIFQDSTISTSSLLPGQRGTFNCRLQTQAADIATYTLRPVWKEFDILPESTNSYHGGRPQWRPPVRNR